MRRMKLKIRVTNSLANQILREDNDEERFLTTYAKHTVERDKKAAEDVFRCATLIYHRTR